VIGFLLGAVLVATPKTAQGHALVLASDPADGALLDAPPDHVTLTFTEPPDPGLSSVRVLTSSGQAIVTDLPAPSGPDQLRVSLPRLGQGVYTVSWRTVSQADGHVTGGSV